jgi:hypothetical protein
MVMQIMERAELEEKTKKELIDIILDIDEREHILWKLHQSDASAWTNERDKKNKYLNSCIFLTIWGVICTIGYIILIIKQLEIYDVL